MAIIDQRRHPDPLHSNHQIRMSRTELSDLQLVKVKKGQVWRAINPADSEPYEEFDRKKIEMALVRAGVRGPNVEQVAALVKPYEGMTTDEIDRIVVAALEKRDPESAKCWKTKRDYDRSRFAK